MAAASWVMVSPGRFGAAQTAGRAGRLLRRHGTISTLPPPLAAWTRARDAPVPPAQTFRQWWRSTHRDGNGQ
jgi:L-lactate dehydrogenase complex protein LldF